MQRIGQVATAVGESPLWCARSSQWLWVDITARTIWRYDPSKDALRSFVAPQMVACIAVDKQGTLVAGMEDGIYALTLDDATGLAGARLLAAPPEDMAGRRFNDGRCDRQGRFWSGTMALAPVPDAVGARLRDGFNDTDSGHGPGNLYRYSGGLSAPVVDHLVVQNGLAWSPDGRTMYLSDSHVSRQMVWAFDYDIDDGVPSRQRVFIDMNNFPGRPDGAAIDVDGCYWTCANDAGLIHRFTPDGRLDRSLAVPMAKPSMCAFGGPGMQSLLVTSISSGAPDGDALAGAVFVLEAGVAGMPETCFGS
jgi:sugar lactone lactonase YvrE